MISRNYLYTLALCGLQTVCFISHAMEGGNLTLTPPSDSQVKFPENFAKFNLCSAINLLLNESKKTQCSPAQIIEEAKALLPKESTMPLLVAYLRALINKNGTCNKVNFDFVDLLVKAGYDLNGTYAGKTIIEELDKEIAHAQIAGSVKSMGPAFKCESAELRQKVLIKEIEEIDAVAEDLKRLRGILQARGETNSKSRSIEIDREFLPFFQSTKLTTADFDL